MTNTTPEIDYALVFEEMRTLNRLFSAHHGPYAPVPNPEHFERIKTGPSGFIIFLGKRSGTHFMAVMDSSQSWVTYGRFSPAASHTREVTDWVWV